MHDPGDVAQEDDDSIQVYRAEEPPSDVHGLIVILKAYTNGLFEAKEPGSLTELWNLIQGAIKESERIEKMIWKKMPEAKFGFKVRNVFKMEQWTNTTTFKLTSTNDLLVITEAQLRSEVPAIGYDLSKIVGYDPSVIISKAGWPIIKRFLLRIMEVAEFSKPQGKLANTGAKLTKTQMKALNWASEGWEI
jgi:hypothetical protein